MSADPRLALDLPGQVSVQQSEGAAATAGESAAVAASAIPPALIATGVVPEFLAPLEQVLAARFEPFVEPTSAKLLYFFIQQPQAPPDQEPGTIIRRPVAREQAISSFILLVLMPHTLLKNKEDQFGSLTEYAKYWLGISITN